MTPVTPSSVALEACRLLVTARVETEEGMSTDIDMLDEALAKARAALAERTQQEAQPSGSDKDFWIKSRASILLAIEKAGFLLMSNKDGFFLHKSSAANSTAPMQPTGWKLVPTEPTYEMCMAEWNISLSDAHTETGVAKGAWAAMLNAAPPAPTQAAPEVQPFAWTGKGCGVMTDKQRRQMIEQGAMGGEFAIAADMARRHDKALVLASDVRVALAASAAPASQAAGGEADDLRKRLQALRAGPANLTVAEEQTIIDCFHALAAAPAAAVEPTPATPDAEERKPMTAVEIRNWWASENGLEDCEMCKLDDFTSVVRAVERKHGIGDQP